MLRIGPAGNSTAFYQAGKKSTIEAAAWLKEIGLTAFEFSFGRGISLSDETAQSIGEEMKRHDIALSCHAPYYINFANQDPQKIQNSFDYVRHSIEKCNTMSGIRTIFHPASQGKLTRNEAFNLTKANIESLMEHLTDQITFDFIICPETMGKLGQIGTVQEVVELCMIHEYLYPCFDFGHINCVLGGGLKDYDDYARIIDFAFDKLGDKKASNMHIHFSKIQYGKSGEIRHLTLADQEYGPDFEPLLRVIKDYSMTPTIIIESAEIMSDDALTMQKYYNDYRSTNKNGVIKSNL